MSVDRFFTVAFLDVSAADMDWIQAFRKMHDPHHAVVDPHFTLVFGISDVAEEALLAHVKGIAQGASPIDFQLRYAMLGADDFDDTAHVFLVPDEGNSQVSLLHDRLHTGVLESHLHLDIPYMPHVTIASTKDRKAAKNLCDMLNERRVNVAGRLTALTVGRLRDGSLQNVATHRLGG